MTFHLPGANFHGSSDDGGRPHAAMRLHRRVLELPGGDLLTTLYGWLRRRQRTIGLHAHDEENARACCSARPTAAGTGSWFRRSPSIPRSAPRVSTSRCWSAFQRARIEAA